MEGVGHAGEAGSFEVDDKILPLGGDDGMAAVSEDQVGEASREEAGVFGMPVHDELSLLAALGALDADGQILAPGDAVQGPHVDRFAPVGHPVGGVGVVVGFALKVLRIEGLGPHIQLDGAVFVLGAQVRPVVPPDVHAVGSELGLVVGVAIVEIVPQEGLSRSGGRFLGCLGSFRDGRFLCFGGFRSGGSSLGRLGSLSAGNHGKDHAGCEDECE